jgi:hypothetical protein
MSSGGNSLNIVPELYISSMYGSSKKVGYEYQQKKLHDKMIKKMVKNASIQNKVKKKHEMFTVSDL